MKKILAKFWDLGIEPAKPRSYYESLLPRIEYRANDVIEHKIHQIYHSRRELPHLLAENVSQIQRLNPEYAYHLWDEQDILSFIDKFYGSEVLALYCKINPSYIAARADLFRYLVLYIEGGGYLDVKSYIEKPLQSTIGSATQGIISHWDNRPGELHESWKIVHKGIDCPERGEFIQWLLIYKSGHPALREVIIDVLMSIDGYNPFVKSVGRGGVLSTTGPIVYTQSLVNYLKAKGSKSELSLVELSDLGIHYSIFERDGDLTIGAHKRFLRNNYWQLSDPIVPCRNKVIHVVSRLLLNIYYMGLDFIYSIKKKRR